MPNVYEEIDGRWKKNNGSFLNETPKSGYWKLTSNSGNIYYQNLATGETTWELPSNRANSTNSANTIASLESSLSSLRSECGAKDAKIAELEAKLKTCGPGPSATPGVNISKFKRMLTMGIPPPAVKQKMQMEGIDPSLLNAANSGAAAPAAAATEAAPAAPFRPPMGGPMAGLLAGIAAGPKLKKTEGPGVKAPLAEEKPKTGAEAAAAGIAAAAAAKRAAMKTNVGNIEARLAAKKAAAATASESAFKKELRSVVGAKAANRPPPPPKRQVLDANEQGALPKGWKYVIDEDGDKYYVKKNGTSQWDRPTAGGSRKGSRKNTRKNRRVSRKTRKHN